MDLKLGGTHKEAVIEWLQELVMQYVSVGDLCSQRAQADSREHSLSHSGSCFRPLAERTTAYRPIPSLGLSHEMADGPSFLCWKVLHG